MADVRIQQSPWQFNNSSANLLGIAQTMAAMRANEAARAQQAQQFADQMGWQQYQWGQQFPLEQRRLEQLGQQIGLQQRGQEFAERQWGQQYPLEERKVAVGEGQLGLQQNQLGFEKEKFGKQFPLETRRVAVDERQVGAYERGIDSQVDTARQNREMAAALEKRAAEYSRIGELSQAIGTGLPLDKLGQAPALLSKQLQDLQVYNGDPYMMPADLVRLAQGIMNARAAAETLRTSAPSLVNPANVPPGYAAYNPALSTSMVPYGVQSTMMPSSGSGGNVVNAVPNIVTGANQNSYGDLQAWNDFYTNAFRTVQNSVQPYLQQGQAPSLGMGLMPLYNPQMLQGGTAPPADGGGGFQIKSVKTKK